MLFKDLGQPELFVPEKIAGDGRIEYGLNPEAKVAFQPKDIIRSGMEDLSCRVE